MLVGNKNKSGMVTMFRDNRRGPGRLAYEMKLVTESRECGHGREGTTKTVRVANGHSGQELGAGRKEGGRHGNSSVTICKPL